MRSARRLTVAAACHLTVAAACHLTVAAACRLTVAAALGGVAAVAGCAPRPAWEQPPPIPKEAPVVQQDQLTRSELDNGLHVLVLEDHRLPRVGLALTVRRGEAMVERGRAGLAAFTAEVMERGAGERDALALAEAVDAIGASLSVSAGWDSVKVTVSGLSRDLDALMEILTDVALRPRFDAAEAEKARSETLASLEKAKDDPATLARWYTAVALFPEHRYGIPLSGEPATVERLDAAAARQFHERVFLPNDGVFSASGDVDTTDILARAERAFGSLQAGEVPSAGPAPPPETPTARKVIVVDRPDLVQARIVVAHEGIARTDPERIAAATMNSVLGGSGFSSRLMSSVRADAGLTYGVHSGFSMRREPSVFLVSTFTRVPEVRTVVDLLLGELERMRAEPPNERELSEAKTLSVGSFSLGLETSEAVMAGLVGLDVYGLPEDSLDTYRARVRALTLTDVAREAHRLLHPERAALVLVGPAEQLVPQVEDLGPVEVLTP
jgi:zinc protease